MKITGSSTLAAPPEQVWQALLDPAVLARCLPGCESLHTIGEDRYAMTVTAGVASVKGTYTGEVALTDLEAPSGLTLRASGAGAPGTVEADVRVLLSPTEGGGTELAYDADATVGGPSAASASGCSPASAARWPGSSSARSTPTSPRAARPGQPWPRPGLPRARGFPRRARRPTVGSAGRRRTPARR
ncbi:SRPBCC family protein [Phycicoccus endophyticus]|uniref:SRPBCC family protein n=1 Tax=Phycicoccus endophyticus TaxID=1690220 RepID=UPI0021D29456|nr:carbon monoxide dehydrogenase subunit G [Phycicoccus endophyticus]